MAGTLTGSIPAADGQINYGLSGTGGDIDRDVDREAQNIVMRGVWEDRSCQEKS